MSNDELQEEEGPEVSLSPQFEPLDTVGQEIRGYYAGHMEIKTKTTQSGTLTQFYIVVKGGLIYINATARTRWLINVPRGSWLRIVFHGWEKASGGHRVKNVQIFVKEGGWQRYTDRLMRADNALAQIAAVQTEETTDQE